MRRQRDGESKDMEAAPGQIIDIADEGEAEDFVAEHMDERLFDKGECGGESFACRGDSIKWPEKRFEGKGVKRLFITLKSAAEGCALTLSFFLSSERVGNGRIIFRPFCSLIKDALRMVIKTPKTQATDERLV